MLIILTAPKKTVIAIKNIDVEITFFYFSSLESCIFYSHEKIS